MHIPHSPRMFGIVAFFIFLVLVTLTFGKGRLPFSHTENTGTALFAGGNTIAGEVAGGSRASTVSLHRPLRRYFSPSSGQYSSFLPDRSLQRVDHRYATPAPPAVPTLPGEYVPDVVLVKVDPALTGSDLEKCLELANATIGSRIKEIDVLQLVVPKGEVAEAIASLSGCPGVSYAEPDYIAQMADTIPNDPGWVNQYGLVAIHAPQGWDDNTGSSAVTIAIVDTGVDLSHEDLAGKIVPGYDFVNNDTVPQDDNGHGTHVAGIAAAITNNNIGVAGVSWGARIMPVKVLDSSGSGSIANVAAGIVWAAQNGAEVINISLGCGLLTCPSPPQVLSDAVDFAYAEHATLVAAAGNIK